MNMSGEDGSEWTEKKIIRLIDEYRLREFLWNSDHDFYKVQSCKDKAWKEISAILDIKISELKRKMSGLLATYRKLRQNILKGLTTERKTRWFAYRSFSFLNDRYHYRPKTSPLVVNTKSIAAPSTSSTSGSIGGLTFERIVNSRSSDICLDDSSPAEDPLGEISFVNTDMNSDEDNTAEEPGPSKRQKIDNSNTLGKCHNMLKVLIQDRQKDQYDIFGEYLASKLRNMSQADCAIVQKEVCELVIKVEAAARKEQRKESHVKIEFFE